MILIVHIIWLIAMINGNFDRKEDGWILNSIPHVYITEDMEYGYVQ